MKRLESHSQCKSAGKKKIEKCTSDNHLKDEARKLFLEAWKQLVEFKSAIEIFMRYQDWKKVTLSEFKKALGEHALIVNLLSKIRKWASHEFLAFLILENMEEDFSIENKRLYRRELIGFMQKNKKEVNDLFTNILDIKHTISDIEILLLFVGHISQKDVSDDLKRDIKFPEFIETIKRIIQDKKMAPIIKAFMTSYSLWEIPHLSKYIIDSVYRSFPSSIRSEIDKKDLKIIIDLLFLPDLFSVIETSLTNPGGWIEKFTESINTLSWNLFHLIHGKSCWTLSFLCKAKRNGSYVVSKVGRELMIWLKDIDSQISQFREVLITYFIENPESWNKIAINQELRKYGIKSNITPKQFFHTIIWYRMIGCIVMATILELYNLPWEAPNTAKLKSLLTSAGISYNDSTVTFWNNVLKFWKRENRRYLEELLGWLTTVNLEELVKRR